MPELNPQTAPTEAPAGTGDGSTPPAATPPTTAPGAATENPSATPPAADPVKPVVAQRDKANEEKRQLQSENDEMRERIEFLESVANENIKKEAIGKFLTENKEKYPDLTFDDLSHIRTFEEMETEADRLQRRLQDHAQAKILEIEQNPQGPPLSPEQRAEKEKQLMEQGGKSALAGAIALRLRP